MTTHKSQQIIQNGSQHSNLYDIVQKVLLKGASIATRAASKWGGVMIKLSGLSPRLLYSVFYFNSAVCRLLSVSC